MSTIFNELFSEWKLQTWAEVLEIIGAIGAIGGFILALSINKKIEKIKIKLLFNVRVTELVLQAIELNSKVSKNLNEGNLGDAKHHIVLMTPIFESISKKLLKAERDNIEKIIHGIGKFKKGRLPFEHKKKNLLYKLGIFSQDEIDEPQIRNIYTEIAVVISEIENLKKDKSITN